MLMGEFSPSPRPLRLPPLPLCVGEGQNEPPSPFPVAMGWVPFGGDGDGMGRFGDRADFTSSLPPSSLLRADRRVRRGAFLVQFLNAVDRGQWANDHQRIARCQTVITAWAQIFTGAIAAV